MRRIWGESPAGMVDTSGYSSDLTIDLREGVDNVSTAGNNALWMMFVFLAIQLRNKR